MKGRRAQEETLSRYRGAARKGAVSADLTRAAREAYLQLSGDPDRPEFSLKNYDHVRWGPFLGVSDEGSAADAILSAASQSPKACALPRSRRSSQLMLGVALDAERLGGIGEVIVGPEEYADIWLGAVDRLFVTTNIGTRVNTRIFKHGPRITLTGSDDIALEQARAEICAAFKPFVETPDKNPRPLTVYIEFLAGSRVTKPKRTSILCTLVEFVQSGEAAARNEQPKGHELGYAVSVGEGPAGRDATLEAIRIATGAGMKSVIVEGKRRIEAERAISLPGLLEYFPPGLIGPIKRAADKAGIQIRTAGQPDTDTIARSVWTGLFTARALGAHLGKYGCSPLSLEETDQVVGHVQQWLSDWSAAPVFFVDQGLIREAAIDVGRDLTRGLRRWLDAVSKHHVPLVLIDTIDKPSGRKLVRKNSRDKSGFMGWTQIAGIDEYARNAGIRTLWAGGLGMRETYAMGKLGVFGVYVTSAAATSIAVTKGHYSRDPALPALKEPTRDGVLRTKVFLEAGFLCSRVSAEIGDRIEAAAEQTLSMLDGGDDKELAVQEKELFTACVAGWKSYWSTL
jgi:hypothetical protein